LVAAPPHEIDVLKPLLDAQVLYDFLDGCDVDLLSLDAERLFSRIAQDKVVHTAGETVHLQVAAEQFGEARRQLPGESVAVQLVERVHQPVVGVTADLILVDEALQQFVLEHQHI